MQCLYCETELKALRGFFDEDFCCREHREKYFSSFRKSWDQMPAHQYVVPEIAIADGEGAPIAPQFAVSTLEAEAIPPHAASNDPEVFVRVFQLVSETAGEPELTATRLAEFTTLNLAASDNVRGSVHAAERIEPSALIQRPPAAASPVAALTESGLIFQFELPDISAAPHWTGAFDARLQLGLPVLAEASRSATLPLADECELLPDCYSLDSHPASALQFAPVFLIELPGFAAVQEALEIESEDQASAGQQISAEAGQDELLIAADLSPQTAAVHRQAIPEIAPPMAFLSSAVAATSLRASEDSDETTSALVPSPSSLSLPGFASILEPVAPAAAAEMVSGAPLEPAPANRALPAAEQDAGKPLRLTFGSLVRIKNWRLRITFARSA